MLKTLSQISRSRSSAVFKSARENARFFPGVKDRKTSFDHRISKLFGSEDQPQMATPKLIVFDLDYTLWPFWVDTHVRPPFQKKSNGEVYDSSGHHIEYFPDVPEILTTLHSQGYKLGIASRTSAIEDAKDLIRLFKWDNFFDFKQIYPGSKITHFKKIRGDSGIEFEDMLFFDDESRNMVDVSTLGVSCMLVSDAGVNHRSLKDGLELFKRRNSHRVSNSL